MAKAKKDDIIDESSSNAIDTKDFFNDILEETKEDHFNYIVPKNSIVSSGSLKIDAVAKFRSGSIIRLCGAGAELGKTSQAFVFAENFMKTFPKSKTLYIKAEARLTPEMRKRVGLNFVSTAQEWNYGTVFVWSVNFFETIASSIEKLLPKMHAAGEQLCIIWDSLDNTILKTDAQKDVWGNESVKVAGVPVLTKLLFKRLGLPVVHYDAFFMVTSQYSAAIKTDPYAKDVPRQVEGSGGSSIGHQSDYVLYYHPRYNGDYILENDKEKPDAIKNKTLGVFANVEFRKSSTDITGLKVRVPIRKGRIGPAIWKEKEVVDLALGYEQLARSGAWCKFTEDIIAQAKKDGIEIKQQHQGLNGVYQYVEDNPEICEWLYDNFMKLLNTDVLDKVVEKEEANVS